MGKAIQTVGYGSWDVALIWENLCNVCVAKTVLQHGGG